MPFERVRSPHPTTLQPTNGYSSTSTSCFKPLFVGQDETQDLLVVNVLFTQERILSLILPTVYDSKGGSTLWLFGAWASTCRICT